jgi:uncharacterized Zn-finger protein
LSRGNAYHPARPAVNPPTLAIPGRQMTPFETIETDEMVVACSGDGPLGHPRVYLNLAPAGRVECPYCSRLFVNRAAMQAPRAAGESAGESEGAAHG